MHVSTTDVILECAHSLDMIGLPEDHPCTRLHGHSYRVSIEMEYSNNPLGLLMDFGDVKKFLRDRYDHRFLNQVMRSAPTAENLAKEIHDELTMHLSTEINIRSVTVAETENNVSTFVPSVEDLSTEEEQ